MIEVIPFFDARTWTLTYLAFDPATRDAVVIDPVLDYDPIAVKISEQSLDAVIAAVQERDLTLRLVLETHAHADHISGAHRLRERLGVPVAISEKIVGVQRLFHGVFNLPASVATDGSQFDRLLKDGEVVELGSLRVEAIATPGHTPACMSYKMGDALFTGDALFMPDYGTGRCDFPSGSAADLYTSVQRIYQLPDETRIFVGHDYQPGGRALAWQTSVGESKKANIQLRADTSREAFVEFRTSRDQTLKLPNLIFQSLQCNIAAGALPAAEHNGKRYLKLPLTA